MNILNNKYLSQVVGGCFCSCFETIGNNAKLINKGTVNNYYRCIEMCVNEQLHYFDCSDMEATPDKMICLTRENGSSASSSEHESSIFADKTPEEEGFVLL